MIILDTDVLSGAIKEMPEEAVIDWLDEQRFEDMWITSITVMEVLMGIEEMAVGKRRNSLESAFLSALRGFLKDRVLPFDQDAAWHAGRLHGRRRRSGHVIGVADTQIAGIALSHGATVATGNVRDFVDAGVTVVNPWDA